MSTTGNDLSDHEAIRALIESYAEGPRLGKSDGMREAFAPDAQMTSGGPASSMESMFSFVDGSDPSPEISAAVKLLYVSGGIATAVVDVKDWGGTDYEDIFAFAKSPDGWRIVGKAYRVVQG